MKIFCISEGKLYRADGAAPRELTCGRIADYLKAVNDMKKRDEWKTAGSGARFMQVEEKYYDTESVFLRGLGTDGTRLIYSTFIDGVGGVYFKDPDTDDETYIFANQSFDPCGISCRNGRCAVDIGDGAYERHIAMLDLSNGGLDQLTEGFTSESYPFVSRSDPDTVYYTAMGYAQNSAGQVLEKSPCAISAYNAKTGELSDVISDSEYDYIKPSDDADGNIYCIRRKYEPTRRNSNVGLDILMFPVRIVKAIGGFLSLFSMRYGGEPLRTGGRNPAKSRAADERELFVEGNMIKAKKISEENPDESIIPSEWVLLKRGRNGEEAVAARSVMDYVLLDSGDIVYSDGSSVKILHTDGKTERICRLKLANHIAVIE